MVGSVDTETARGERAPERALVRAGEAVRVGLDPRRAGGQERRVAGLKGERVDEEVEEDNVAAGAVRVRERVGGEAVGGDERSVDVVEDVGPGLARVLVLSSCTVRRLHTSPMS